MANNTDWLNISPTSGSSGQTTLTLTANTNTGSTRKTATVKAYNTVCGITSMTYVVLHCIVPIPYTADTSTLSYTGGSRTITIDASDIIPSSITISVSGATGVTYTYNDGLITVTFPQNNGDGRNIDITIDGSTQDGDEAKATITYFQRKNYSTDYLTFKISGNTGDAGEGTLSFACQLDYYDRYYSDPEHTLPFTSFTRTVEYSKNGSPWTSITVSASTSSTFNTVDIPVSPGDEIKLRGNNSSYAFIELNTETPADGYPIVVFNSHCSFFANGLDCEIYGNIMSLVSSSSFSGLTVLQSEAAFLGIFSENYPSLQIWRLKDAGDLVLPATTLSDYCYYQMFLNCKYLTKIPELPATTLADSCYGSMFRGCTSLTTAPELPATTLAFGCYYDMFVWCHSLQTAPVLPATTLAQYCYHSMFHSCTSLTSAPALPATALTNYCYSRMFEGCASLTSAPALPATTLEPNCYNGMFAICTSLTSAPSLPATALTVGCYNGMFYGCTSLTTAPALPATTLADSCYGSMFYGCTSLTAAPELPATKLKSQCYRTMFYGCSNLSYIKCLATDISARYCTSDWVNGVASSGIFIKNYEMSDWGTDSVDGIPFGWFVLDNLYFISYTADTSPVANTGETRYITIDTSTLVASSITVSVSGATGATVSYSNRVVTVTFPELSGKSRSFSVTVRGLTLNNIDAYAKIDYTQYSQYYNDYFTFRIKTSGSIRWRKYTSSTESRTIQYSKNNGSWVSITSTSSGVTFSVSAGDVVRFRGDNSIYGWPDTSASTSSSVIWYPHYTTFSGSTASFDVEGNIMSLIDSTSFTSITSLESGYTFKYLFEGCKVLSAENLVLPATAEYCYQDMFCGCTSLTTAPALPATTLASHCYSSMFNGCTSLTTAPELPATTLAGGCYAYMFRGCTSLTSAPALPATTLAPSGCYEGMFYGCSGLTTAPELPATTLANNCYQSMFSSCTSLTSAPSLPATTLVSSCYEGMFYNCTSLTTAPALPATTLESYCYRSMFRGCTSLTTAPELPATTLEYRCYDYMFSSCTSLNYIKCLATNVSNYYRPDDWVIGVASTGTFVKNPNTTSWTTGDSGIPSGWTVQDAT